jgi:hypothetical protein
MAHYKSLGAEGIRQLQTLKPKKSEFGDKSITEYTAVVIEGKEEVLSVPKLNKFGFSTSKIDNDDDSDEEKMVPKFKKFGFSSAKMPTQPKEIDSDEDEKLVPKFKKFGFSKL